MPRVELISDVFHYYYTALALHREGFLGHYITGPSLTSEEAWLGRMGGPFERLWQERRLDGLPPRKVKRTWMPELLRRALPRFGGSYRDASVDGSEYGRCRDHAHHDLGRLWRDRATHASHALQRHSHLLGDHSDRSGRWIGRGVSLTQPTSITARPERRPRRSLTGMKTIPAVTNRGHKRRRRSHCSANLGAHYEWNGLGQGRPPSAPPPPSVPSRGCPSEPSTFRAAIP